MNVKKCSACFLVFGLIFMSNINEGLALNGSGSGSPIYAISSYNNANFSNYTSTPITNTYKSIFNGTTLFENNTANGYSGAIHNAGLITFNGKSSFNNNSGTQNAIGGAIFNTDNVIFNGTSQFDNNYALHGGAIANDISSIINFYDSSSFNNNSSGNTGGAIFNNGNITFSNGSTLNLNSSNYGGAIFNCVGNVIFGNNVILNNNSVNHSGGAIFNSRSNLIFNDGANFTNNTALVAGGAIYSGDAKTTLIADTNNVTFTGNTANGQSNAIYLEYDSTLNLNASSILSSSDNGKVIFNDSITSGYFNNIININQTGNWNGQISTLSTSNAIRSDAPTTGEIVLNADMSSYTDNLNFYGGSISLLNGAKFFKPINFMAQNGTRLNLTNNQIDNITIGTSNIDNMLVDIDVDLNNQTTDNFDITTVDTNNSLTVSSINILSEGTKNGSLAITNQDTTITVDLSTAQHKGRIFDYTFSGGNSGQLNFTGSTAPSVKAASVSQQSTFANFNNINNITTARADNMLSLMSDIKQASGIDYDNINKIAISDLDSNPEYRTLYSRVEKGSSWFRPFASMETINLDNIVSDVDSNSYGFVVGYDTPIKKIKKSYKRMFSYFGGYNAGYQKYTGTNNVKIHQNGGFGGAMMSLFKGNFYTSISTTLGMMKSNENISGFGSAKYDMLIASLNSKSGYNFNLNDKTRLQINGLIGATITNPDNYTNAQGTNISSDNTTILQFVPGLKLSRKYKGSNVYLSTNSVFNDISDNNVTANNVLLPNSKVGNYFEYGVGIEKQSTSGKIGFAQVMGRSGNRKGINLQFGLKIPVGENI